MGIQISLTPDGIGVVFRSFDILTGQDLLDADAQLRVELTRRPELRYLLIDHSALPEGLVDTASLRSLAEGVRGELATVPEGLVAIVAPTDILFGLARMWESLAAQPRLATYVTRTRTEATDWLQRELARRGLTFQLAE